MTDVASIGVETHVTNGETAVRQLDAFGAATERAENSAKGASSATSVYNKMLVDLLRSIDRTLVRLTAITQAQSKLRSGTIRLAEDQIKLSMAAEREAAAMQQASAATDKASVSIGKAGRTAKVAAMDFATLYDLHSKDFVTQYVSGMGKVVAVTGRADKSAKYMTQTTLNLSRQFADIGVTAAMGMSPLMILIQQGPQIADAFATAKAEGLGFNAVLAGMGRAIAPFLAIILPVLAVITALGVAFGVATQQINKGSGDLTRGMGLTADQLEKVKQKTVTFGDTVKATFQVAGERLYHAFKGPIDATVKAIQNAYQMMVDKTVNFIKDYIGLQVGLVKGVQAIWSDIPAIIGDAAITAFNFVARKMADVVNLGIRGLNKISSIANEISMRLGGPSLFGEIAEVAAQEIENPFAGVGANAGKKFMKGFNEGLKDGRGAVQDFFDDVGDRARANRRALIRKEAGDAAKTPKGRADPRDQTDERIAEIQQMLAQAMAEELQARLSLAKEVDERLGLEKLILAEQLKAKNAAIDKKIASIQDDKGLSNLSKGLLSARLREVKAVNETTTGLQVRRATELAIDVKAKEQLAIQTAQGEAQIDLLQNESSLAKYAFQRRAIDQQILKLQTQIEKNKLQEVIDSSQSSLAEKEIAKAKLATLDIILEAQLREANGLEASFRNVSSALGGLGAAFKNRDWKGVADQLFEAVGSFRASWKQGGFEGRAGAVAGVASVAGGFLGGRAGRALSGAAAGASIGTAIAPGIGTAIGAVLGGIAGALSPGSGAKSAARAQAAEDARRHAIEIANQKIQMEVSLLELQGKASEALALARKAELAAMDFSLRSLQEQLYVEQDAAILRALNVDLMRALGHEEEAIAATRQEELRTLLDIYKPFQQSIWALQDLKDAADKLAATAEAARDIQISILYASGDAIGALTLERQRELEALDASLRPMQQHAWALQDAQAELQTAQDAMADAREELSKAYKRDIEIIQDDLDAMDDTINKLRDVGTAFQEFADQLKFDPANNNLTPTMSTDRLRKEFERLAALPPGDQERLDKLQGVSQQFLDASRSSSATGSAYNRDLQAVRRAVEASQNAVAKQLSEAELQRAAAERQLNALIVLQQKTDGVAGAALTTTVAVNNLATATAGYAAAQAGYAAAQAAASASVAATLAAQGAAQQALAIGIAQAQATASTALSVAQQPVTTSSTGTGIFDPDAYLAANPGVAAEFARHTSNSDIAYLASLGIYNAQGYAVWHNQQVMNHTPGFAMGGTFSNGIVTRPTMFGMGKMGEAGPEAIMPLTNINGQLGVRASNDNGDMVQAIRAMHDSLAEGFRAIARMANSLDKLEVMHDRWDKRGLYVRGEAPGEPVKVAA